MRQITGEGSKVNQIVLLSSPWRERVTTPRAQALMMFHIFA